LNTQKSYPLILIILCLVLFFFGLGSRDFWAPVEPRYAEIARVMFAKGEWIVPTVNGSLYTDKPILYFWIVLIVSNIAGAVNEWTVRIPAALGGVGFVLSTYFLGRDFFSPRVGFIAALALATSMRVIWEARWAHVDTLFCFFFALSIYFAARSLLRKGSPNEILLAYVFVALATLAKGLIGVVLPALLFAAFIITRREWRLIVDAKLLLGIPIFLLVVAPWFYLVNSATEGKWLADFIYLQHIQRYTKGVGHRQPFYYYFTTLPVDLLPWTVFGIAGLFAYWPFRQVRNDPVVQFFVLWFLVVFLFFTISDTKRELYLLSLLPTLAFFVANYLDAVAKEKLPQNSLYRWLTIIFFGTLAFLGLALPVAAWFMRRDAFAAIVPASAVLAAGGICTMRYIWVRRPMIALASVAGMMTLTIVAASVWIMPYLEQFKSKRPFSLVIKKIVSESEPLYIYADTMNDFNYYTEREAIPVIPSAAALDALLARGQSGYILIKDRDFKRIQPIPPEWIVATDSKESTVWSLVKLGVQPRR
jgi:4-amino-4-deoxy-L-arabinose transferase-like glycosyltransferase